MVGSIGPRQVGKTTLARRIAADWTAPTHHFDLEDPADLARLTEPGLTLRPLTGLVVIDEVQLMPELLPLLRVLADRDSQPASRVAGPPGGASGVSTRSTYAASGNGGRDQMRTVGQPSTISTVASPSWMRRQSSPWMRIASWDASV